MNAYGHQHPDDYEEDAVLGNTHSAESHHAVKHRRSQCRERCRPPQQPRQVRKDYHQAEGDKNLRCHLAIGRANKEALKHQAHQCPHCHRAQGSKPKITRASHNPHTGVATPEKHGAMGKVQHPHHTKYNGKTCRHEKDERSVCQTIDE